MSYKEVWYKLKDWISLECWYDFDTITFIDLYEKMHRLESEIKNDSNLQELIIEHSIMKQFIYDNGLWDKFLNDNRFLEYLRSDVDE